MPAFFFPLLWLIPDFDAEVVGNEIFRIHKRRWDVSIFDLYSLVAERHTLRLPAELMHIFLQSVNLEIEVAAKDFLEAQERIDIFRALICLRLVSPTVAPFASNTSLNQYAGINGRSSGALSSMHEGLREGITHKTARIETWSHELTFSCIRPMEGTVHKVSEGPVEAVLDEYDAWAGIESRYTLVRAARRALVKSPLMPDIQSSILQIWQGIESLFPSVSTEITFRTSLLLAELLVDSDLKFETYTKARKSYGDRSKISHGSQREATLEQWSRAWKLLRNALQAILSRRALPSEEELISELLRGGGREERDL